MEAIYHLVTPSAWQADPGEDYRAASLPSEGFIHCSFARQVAWAANRFYADAEQLLVLEIDPSHLVAPLRVEPPSGSAGGELFPHIHGPLNRAAVVKEHALRRGDDGRWVFPS
jgi:uncharacterized protein (DUF952 family)